MGQGRNCAPMIIKKNSSLHVYSKYDEYHEEVIRDVLNFLCCSFGQKCIVSQMGLATGPQSRC